MENKKLDRIINIIREEMMTTGSTPGKPGFSSAAPAKGPTAGFDPVMGKMMKRKKKKYISMGKGSRKRWM
jgi:hypothetical protein|tara:strand:- start:114 stop:323 length:210 start_codon:yes stop_codon:yes gene_type:complete